MAMTASSAWVMASVKLSRRRASITSATRKARAGDSPVAMMLDAISPLEYGSPCSWSVTITCRDWCVRSIDSVLRVVLSAVEPVLGEVGHLCGDLVEGAVPSDGDDPV